MKNSKKRYLELSLTLLLVAVAVCVLFYINGYTSKYIIRITRLCAINVVLALSMNLVQGFTGIFSLGHAGFMAIGAYTVALLTIPLKKKDTIFILEPLIAPLNTLTLPFGVALIIGGLLAAAAAFLIGLPCLRLRGDYLAIATLGFSEIIRIIITNAQSLTNGAQGLKSIPATADIWWCYGIALAVILFMVLFIRSSHGNALKAIREDEIAAESMGVPLLGSKMLSFMISAFLAGVGGGLYASYIGTIGPDVFQIARTYDILMIVVMGGMGSISGSVIAAFIVTIGQEWLRVLDGPLPFLPFWPEAGISGMRMVVFSLLLLVIILFFRKGLLGGREITWPAVFSFVKKYYVEVLITLAAANLILACCGVSVVAPAAGMAMLVLGIVLAVVYVLAMVLVIWHRVNQQAMAGVFKPLGGVGEMLVAYPRRAAELLGPWYVEIVSAIVALDLAVAFWLFYLATNAMMLWVAIVIEVCIVGGGAAAIVAKRMKKEAAAQ